jgi:hypothetical protein
MIENVLREEFELQFFSQLFAMLSWVDMGS